MSEEAKVRHADEAIKKTRDKRKRTVLSKFGKLKAITGILHQLTETDKSHIDESVDSLRNIIHAQLFCRTFFYFFS